MEQMLNQPCRERLFILEPPVDRPALIRLETDEGARENIGCGELGYPTLLVFFVGVFNFF